MAVPKASVHEDCPATRRKYHIGTARQIATVKTIPVSQPVHESPNKHLGLRVPTTNKGHALASLFRRKSVHRSRSKSTTPHGHGDIGCGGRIRTDDLRVMSPTSFHCSTPRRWTKQTCKPHFVGGCHLSWAAGCPDPLRALPGTWRAACKRPCLGLLRIEFSSFHSGRSRR